MVMELDSEYKQCNVLKPGGKITLSEKVKDYHKIPSLVYMKTKKKNLPRPLHQTVELLIYC